MGGGLCVLCGRRVVWRDSSRGGVCCVGEGGVCCVGEGGVCAWCVGVAVNSVRNCWNGGRVVAWVRGWWVWGCGGVGMWGCGDGGGGCEGVRVVGGFCVSVQVTSFPNQLTWFLHD